MKYILILSSFLILLTSCLSEKANEEDKENKIPIEKIIIQNYPSFHLPSMFVCDLTNREIIFQRIGRKEKYEVTPLPEGKAIKTLAPKSCRFQIDSLNYQILIDSILVNFSKDDFIDKSEDYDDGIGNSFLYVFQDGNYADIELTNSYTDNQIKLLKFLISSTEKINADSLTADYLNNLIDYYE